MFFMVHSYSKCGIYTYFIILSVSIFLYVIIMLYLNVVSLFYFGFFNMFYLIMIYYRFQNNYKHTDTIYYGESHQYGKIKLYISKFMYSCGMFSRIGKISNYRQRQQCSYGFSINI